jgi:hypothetical protein
MRKHKINILLFWFIILLTFQLSFGLKALNTQFDLKNKKNIVNDLEPITQISSPTAITDQVLILFVDGLRYDKMVEANTPNIDRIRNNGTTFSNYHAILPSYSMVNYAAFSTGSTTNMTNVFANGYNGKLSLPTLFSLINDLNKSLIAGGNSWFKFLGDDADVSVQVEVEYHSYNEGAKIRDAALATIPGNFSQIQFVGFDDVDAAGHAFGAASNEYIEIIEKIDSYIGEILDLYGALNQLNNTTIVLFSDHGHDDIGGHGGESFDETHGTFVLAGKGIANWNIISNEIAHTNFVTPTLLAMLGLPLAPTMNGQPLLNYINSSDETKAIYSIQTAEIVNQQLNATVNKFRILSNSLKYSYYDIVDYFNDNLTEIKSDYLLGYYNTSYENASTINKQIRLYFRALTIRLESITRLVRTLVVISILTVIAAILFYLQRRKVIVTLHQNVFSFELILPQLLGFFLALLVVLNITILYSFSFNSTSFNSTHQVVPPVLLSFFIGSVILIFSPWLILYLFDKNKSEKKKFKDWKVAFLRSSIGSIFFLSLPVFSYFLIVVSRFGPWPSWNLFPLVDTYAYMIIGIMSCIIYLIGLVLMLVLRRYEEKQKRLAQNMS